MASTARWVVSIAASAFAKPLNGPRDGESSNRSSTSSGSQPGAVLTDTKILAGRKARNVSNCCFQSGRPQNSSVALSRPIRRESPPARRSALNVIRLPPVIFVR